jgi:hypothetical protein
MNIILMTAGRLLESVSSLKLARKKNYFGVMMKIIKTYSKIHTSNPKVNDALKSNSALITKFDSVFQTDFDQLCTKSLGSY